MIVGPPGIAFPCTVSDAANPSESVEYTATITDDSGAVAFSRRPPS